MGRPRKYTIGSRNDTGWIIREISPEIVQNTHMLWISHEDTPGVWYEVSVFMFNNGASRINRTLAKMWADKLYIEHPELQSQLIEGCYIPLVLLELPDAYFTRPGLKICVSKSGDKQLYYQSISKHMRDYRMFSKRLLITEEPQVIYEMLDQSPSATAFLRDQDLMRRVAEARKGINKLEQNYLRSLMEYRNARASIVNDLFELHGAHYNEPYWLPAAPPGENTEPPKLAPLVLPDGPVNIKEREEAEAWIKSRQPTESPSGQAMRMAQDATTRKLEAVLAPAAEPFVIPERSAGLTSKPGEALDTKTLPLALDEPEKAFNGPLEASDQTDLQESDTVSKATTVTSKFDDEDDPAMNGFAPPSGYVRPRNPPGTHHQNFGDRPLWEAAPHLYANYRGDAKYWHELTDEQVLEIGGMTKSQGRLQKREHLIMKEG